MNIVELVAQNNQRIARLERIICELQACCAQNTGGGGDDVDKRFAVPTEDDTAGEDRQFDMGGHNFSFYGGPGSFMDHYLNDPDTSQYGEIYVDPTVAYLSSGDGIGGGSSVTSYPNEVEFYQNDGSYVFRNLQENDAAEYYLIEQNGYVARRLINPTCKTYTYVSSFSTPGNISTIGTGSGDLSTMTKLIISDFIGPEVQFAWLNQLVGGNIVTMTKVGDPAVSATMTLSLDQNGDPDFRVYNIAPIGSVTYSFIDGDQFQICWEAPPEPFRFGVSGEDDIATETRQFDIDPFDFYITSGSNNFHQFALSPVNGANYLIVSNETADAHVNTSISPSNEAVVEIHTHSGFFSSSIRPDSVDPSPGANMSILSSYNDLVGNILSHEIQVNYDGIVIAGVGSGSFSASNFADIRITGLPTATVFDRLLVMDFSDSNKIKMVNPSVLSPIFTPANSTDNTYPNGTLTKDDTYLWFRTSTGVWKKVAWTAF